MIICGNPGRIARGPSYVLNRLPITSHMNTSCTRSVVAAYARNATGFDPWEDRSRFWSNERKSQWAMHPPLRMGTKERQV